MREGGREERERGERVRGGREGGRCEGDVREGGREGGRGGQHLTETSTRKLNHETL